jgi:hypothetical protein
MRYKKRKTVEKTMVPAVVLIGGANLIKYITSLAGNEMDGEIAYSIVSMFYIIGSGLINWLKHR